MQVSKVISDVSVYYPWQCLFGRMISGTLQQHSSLWHQGDGSSPSFLLFFGVFGVHKLFVALLFPVSISMPCTDLVSLPGDLPLPAFMDSTIPVPAAACRHCKKKLVQDRLEDNTFTIPNALLYTDWDHGTRDIFHTSTSLNFEDQQAWHHRPALSEAAYG